MTKKDYTILANAMKEAALLSNATQEQGVYMAATVLATALAKDNPKFDIERFIVACGFIY